MAATNEHSTVTRRRRVKLCQASSDAAKPLAPITHIAFGSGGAGEDGEPLDPLETQEALAEEIARYPVGTVAYPVDTTARYSVTIPADALVGRTISEAALIDSDGDVAAVKNMYPKRKDPGVAFTFEFDDEF